ncbi:cytochrome c biogenesis protein CcdC [Paenibacillus alginolyticus]|uniref:CcdC protein domain-containing protein n=1 Tax=Paenibacillus alginolyticus TaxID=59839 RepID=UPI000415B26C|nr:CcdC protein domain-containing protein [Paenibacillus alginolyticus]MCY9670697.1 cytochrome c biogenesis protein CcdC [Paenibacillus alginolyticus]
MNSTVSMMISALIFFFILRGQLSGMRKPLKTSGVTLLLPILYISTSLMQLFDPSLHIREEQVIIALLIGMIVSIPLILTTNFEVRDNGNTFIKRNKTVFVLLIVIFALRFLAIATIKSIVPSTLSFMCNLITFGYIATWRIISFIKFRSVSSKQAVLNV